jgi:GNAT superfamily N-acetyltransferase
MTTLKADSAHPATPDERSDVVGALAAAFFGDRIYRWLIPDDVQRRCSAALFYARFVDACWPHGGVYAAGGGTGAALWLPPGEQLVDDDEAEAFGRDLVSTCPDEASSQRQAQLFEMLDDYHPAQPYWYLAFMGVHPDGQGRGLGAAMLEAVLAQADRDGMPAYLEASCPTNQRLYERHGFETMTELTVADSPAIYPMWRRPGARR